VRGTVGEKTEKTSRRNEKPPVAPLRDVADAACGGVELRGVLLRQAGIVARVSSVLSNTTKTENAEQSVRSELQRARDARDSGACFPSATHAAVGNATHRDKRRR